MTDANNPRWWPKKGSKILETILVNSSTKFQPENKTYIWKPERNLIKLHGQNVSSLFNQTCLKERLLPDYTHRDIIHIYKQKA